jgi:hypothetical protein
MSASTRVGATFGSRHEIDSSYHNGVYWQRQEGFALARIHVQRIYCLVKMSKPLA